MIPLPRQGGTGLRFRLFGFPVRIHWSFLLIAALLGLGSPGVSFAVVATWTAIVFVSVLVHELGHAFAARGFGASPTIDLFALGGVTAFVPPKRMGRAGSIWVTLAGPLAGFALGGFVLSVAGAFGVDRPSLTIYRNSSIAEQAVSISIYVNLVWGLVNLLPILPLDGGNVVRNLLPGTPEQRGRTAAIASIVMAFALLVWIVRADLGGLSTLWLLPVMLAGVNLQSLLAERRAEEDGRSNELLFAHLRALDAGEPGALDALARVLPVAPADARDRAKVTAIEILLRQGRGGDARRALTALAGAAHPSVYALVDTVDGSAAHGVSMLDDLFARNPSPALGRAVLLGRVLAGRGTEVPAVHVSLLPYLGAGSGDVLRELQHVAHVRGDFHGAVLIGEHLLAGGVVDPWVLYNLACSSARAGDPARALWRLGQAVDAGWNDAAQLDQDHDLSSLWVLPEFRALRARVAGVATG